MSVSQNDEKSCEMMPDNNGGKSSTSGKVENICFQHAFPRKDV